MQGMGWHFFGSGFPETMQYALLNLNDDQRPLACKANHVLSGQASAHEWREMPQLCRLRQSICSWYGGRLILGIDRRPNSSDDWCGKFWGLQASCPQGLLLEQHMHSSTSLHLSASLYDDSKSTIEAKR